MAIPKVFVSSTCYDLQEERAQLERFISGYGFQPVLSEYSGVFYNPDEHTHDSCIKEVANADLFVLIISGRFGGRLRDGEGESITQAEYNEARRQKIPIFAFVKADVLAAQFYYKENLRSNDEDFAKKIKYPAIENQNDAVDIFNFIQQVQRSQTNNAIEQYTSFSGIEDHLKKQWAGMFYSFLEKRKEQDKVANMSVAIDKLVGSTSKLESLVSSLHDKEVGQDQTKKLILENAVRRYCFDFYKQILDTLGNQIDVYDKNGNTKRVELYINKSTLLEAAKTTAGDDIESYIARCPLFIYSGIDKDGDLLIRFCSDQTENYFSEDDFSDLEESYNNGICQSDENMRLNILKEVFEPYIS